MVAAFFWYLVIFLLIRCVAGYDSRFQTGRYLAVNNRFFRVLLVDKSVFFERRNRLKQDQNRLSLPGTVLYGLWLLGAILSGLFLFCLPRMPRKPLYIEAERSVNTVNETVVWVGLLVLLSAVLGYLSYYMIRYTKSVSQKSARVLTDIFAVMIFLVILGMWLIVFFW